MCESGDGTDFDGMVQFFISFIVSRANTNGTSRFREARRLMAGGHDTDPLTRTAMRAAQFTFTRKGKERRRLINEARRDFNNRKARECPTSSN